MHRMLHVEDEVLPRESFSRLVKSVSAKWSVDSALSLESAQRSLEDGNYDLVVCDIVIPPVDGSLSVAPEHGFEVYRVVREALPGTPAIFLTGHASEVDAWSRLEESPTLDLFGLGEPEPLTRLFQKDDPETLRSYVVRMTEELDRLHTMEISVSDDDDISEMDRRCLAILSRRQSGCRVQVRASHGLSGASSFLSKSFDDDDRLVARTFVKTGEQTEVKEEVRRHERYVGRMLDSGDYPGISDQVIANCRSRAAICYSIAGRYTSDLFELCSEADGESVAASVATVRRMLDPWSATRTSVQVNLGDLRRRFVSDEVVDQHVGNSGGLVELLSDAESRSFDLCSKVQHGDLHGLNLMLDSDSRALLIDFGDTGVHLGALDPVTLELSLVFHSRSPLNSWPDLDSARAWVDIDIDRLDSVPAAIARSCREWARQEFDSRYDYLCATLVHALRQLKYPDTDKSLATAIAASAAGSLV